MAKFRMSFKASVAKDLRQILKHDVQGILKRIERLADDPRPSGSEKLSAQERYRVRQGTHRIVYEMREQELVVMAVKIGHRRDVRRFLCHCQLREKSMIKEIVRIKNIKDDNLMDDLTYWLSKTPDERVSAVEFLRRQAHGTTPRLQRVAQIVQRP